LTAIATGDVNGDARPDLVTADPGPSTLSFLLNGGGGSFSAGPDLGAVSPQGLAVADLDGDGKPDLVYTDPVDDQLVVALADASGLNYNNETAIPTGGFPTGVALGDLNGDGIPDIAVTNSQDNTVMIFLASAPGTYPSTPTTTLAAGTFPTSVTIADLNGDGQRDLVVTNRNGGSITLFTQSAGSYTPTTISTGAGSGPTSAAVADLNGDGIADVAVADGTDGAAGNSVTVLLGTGGSGYTASTLAAGRSPSAVVIGDFNGDGRPDIADANRLDNTVTVFLKDATGSTYTPTTLAVGGGPISLVAGDLVGDGRLDLATANTFSGDVTLLTNTTIQGSKTTLTASPSTSHFGQSVTFTAAVGPKVPLAGAPTATGTVTYTVDGFALPATTMSGGSASLATQELGVGTHTITTAYSGDANYAPSTATLSYTVTATTTITGAHGSLSVTVPTLVTGATITGSISVSSGGALDLENSTVTGSVGAGATGLRICGTSIGGSLSVGSSAGLVVIGDTGDAQCAVNTIGGSIAVQSNTHGVELIGNTYGGAIATSGNSGPGPFPGDATTISGNHH
jgi:hypothetical protein